MCFVIGIRRDDESEVSELLCRDQKSVGTVLRNTTYIQNCSLLIRVPLPVLRKRLSFVRPTQPVGSCWRRHTESARLTVGRSGRRKLKPPRMPFSETAVGVAARFALHFPL